MAGKRYYTCNYNYFDEVDTEEKAYWLGFIMADGCVMHHKRKRVLKTMTSIQERKLLQIGLSSRDVGHIDKFKTAISSTHPTKMYDVTHGFKTDNQYARLLIEDSHLFESLSRYNIYPNKSGSELFPDNLKDEFILPYIRGYFDGDGCISSHINKHNSLYFEINIVGTKELLTIIAKYLGINNPLTQRHPERCVNNYTLRAGGNRQVERILSLLYENASVYLDRKYEKYIELKKKNQSSTRETL